MPKHGLYLMDLLLVVAAVNSPRGSFVLQPVSNLVKALLHAVPVAAQAAQQAIKMLAGTLHLYTPAVQIAQSGPAHNHQAFAC